MHAAISRGTAQSARWLNGQKIAGNGCWYSSGSESRGAYVPIDPEYPEERIRYILENSNAQLLLTQRELLSQVPFEGKVLALDEEQAYSGDGSNLEAIVVRMILLMLFIHQVQRANRKELCWSIAVWSV